MPTKTKAKVSTITAIILALISGTILIASIVEISTNNDNPTSGAMTDGCCYGGLGLILSCFIFSIAGLVQIGGLYFFLDNLNEVEMVPPKD